MKKRHHSPLRAGFFVPPAKPMPDRSEIYASRPVGEVQALIDPAWAASDTPNGLLVQLHHPQHGWLSFLLSDKERKTLRDFLNRNTEATQEVH